MKKLLIVGENNSTIMALGQTLAIEYEVKISHAVKMEIIRELKNVNPDAIIMYQFNKGEINPYVLNMIASDYPETPLIVICREKDKVDFAKIKRNTLHLLFRPVTAAKVLDTLKELCGDDAKENEANDIAEASAEEEAESDEQVLLSQLLYNETPPAKVEEPVVTEDKGTGKKRILAVDDDPTVLRFVYKVLNDDYEVLIAPSGEKALEIVDTKRVDMILLDYEMPGADGAEMIAAFRWNINTESTPIVFLTGVSDKKRIQAIIGYRPTGYLLKPIDSKVLRETVEKIIG